MRSCPIPLPPPFFLPWKPRLLSIVMSSPAGGGRAAAISWAICCRAPRPTRYSSRLCRPFSTPLATAAKAAKITPAMSANKKRARSSSTRVNPASPWHARYRPNRLPSSISCPCRMACLLPLSCDLAHSISCPHGVDCMVLWLSQGRLASIHALRPPEEEPACAWIPGRSTYDRNPCTA